MKRIILSFLLALCTLIPAGAQTDPVRGPQGNLSMEITLPDGFNPATDYCPMVILMHGIFSKKEHNPVRAIARGLAAEGIASIRFDFDGHGKSEGRIQDMTVEKEIADAMAILAYVRKLPYVSEIGFLGHSQGGVVASMTAGRLAAEGSSLPKAMVLIAPGSIIKEACQNGKFFFTRFDPTDPPEAVRIWGSRKLGREYITQTQELDIFGTAAAYQGPVRIIHGAKDGIVPLWCSEKYLEAYGDRAELTVVKGENHRITKKRKDVVAMVVAFFKESL